MNIIEFKYKNRLNTQQTLRLHLSITKASTSNMILEKHEALGEIC